MVTTHPGGAALGLAADDKVEPHALEAQFQIDQIEGIDLADHGLAVAVDRFVTIERHDRGESRKFKRIPRIRAVRRGARPQS